MLKTLVIGALVAAFVTPAAADDPPAGPPPGTVAISIVSVNGSGCAPGSTEIAVREDGSAFDILFGAYQAGVGPGFLPTDIRRNCQVSVLVNPPPGFSYAIATAEYRGYASIAAGATVSYRAHYYFKGQTTVPTRTWAYTGPYNDGVGFVDVTDVAQTIWSPCGQLRNTNISTEVRVNAGTSDVRHVASSASLDRAGAFTLRWRTCT